MASINIVKVEDLFDTFKVRSFYVKDGGIYARIGYEEEVKVNFSLLDIYITAYKTRNAWFASSDMKNLSVLLTEEFYRTNFISILNELDVLPMELSEYDFVFDYLFENKRYDLIFQSNVFEEMLYEKYKDLDEENEEYQEFLRNVDKLIDSFGDKVPDKYSFSILLACFVLDRSVLLFENGFSHDVKSRYTEECEDYFDDFAKLSYLPSYLTGSKAYFDYIYEKKNLSLLMGFDRSLLTDEFILNNYEWLKGYFEEGVTIHPSLRNCTLIYDMLVSHKRYGFIYDCMDVIPTVEDLKKDEEFFKYFIKNYNPKYRSKNKNELFKENVELFNFVLEKGEYQFAFDCFEPSLFTLDVVKKYPDMIAGIGKKYKIDFCLSYDILKYYLEQEDYFMTPVHLFDNNTLCDAMNEMPDKMKALILERIRDFSWCYSALSFMIEEKEYSTFSEFDSTLWDEEICSDLDEGFCDYLGQLETESTFYFRKIKCLFDFCVEKKRFDVICDVFDDEFFTDEFVRKYADELIEASDEFLSYKIKNDYIFERAIQKGEYELAGSYEYITNDHIDKYFNELLSAVGVDSGVKLKTNEYFIQKCIKEKVPNLLTFISGRLVNEELLNDNEEEVKKLLDSDESYDFLDSPVLFKFILENNLVRYINRLGPGALDETYVVQYLDLLDENITAILPDVLFASDIYLKHCIDNGKSDLVSLFCCRCYDGLSDDYIAKLVSYLKTPFEGNISFSYKILEYFVKNGKLEYISEFDEVVLGYTDYFRFEILFESSMNNGRKLLSDNLSTVLYPYFVKNGLPENLKGNVFFLKLLLIRKGYKLIEQFNSCVFEELDPTKATNILEKHNYINYIIDYIDNFNGGLVPANIAGSTMIRNEIFRRNRDDLLLQFVLNVKSEDMLKRYARQLGYDYDQFKGKVDYLLTRNDELFNTVMPLMFKEKMDVIAFKHLEKIMLYPDLQVRLINMDERYLKFMSKVFDLLDDEKYDYSGVIVSLIENVSNHEELMNSVDLDNITKEEFIRLITVISKKGCVFRIKNAANLKEENYERVRNNLFNIVKKKVKEDNISIHSLKRALLEMKFGLSYSQADFIVQRYCHSLKSLDVSYFDKRLFTILSEIDHIMKCESIDELKYLFINSKKVKTDFYTSISLESSIRKEFAKLYSDTLYKVNKEHKVSANEELKSSNKELYSKLSNLSYNGKEIPVYVMDGEFNLQIHALGAYRHWERPDNFKNDWERPKIAYHGICTSYIGNNQIANARATHPILGFDEYESSAVLCAGNYDLFSDPAISRYDASMYKPYHFFLPKDMIDNTRHTHNEMVIERRYNKRGSSYKRLPNYVVMLVDDINNMDNYENDLWDEYCQAASDFGIPIVIVDRLKYAKSEMEKIENMVQEFGVTNNMSLIDKIIVEFCNNMIGCNHFKDTDRKPYHDIFTATKFDKIVNKLISYILMIDDEYVRISLLSSLNTAINNEMKKGSVLPTIVKLKELVSMYGIKEEEEIKNNISLDKQTLIHNYYYNAKEEVQKLVEKDLNDNVDLDTILLKINEGIYEGGIKI